MCTTCGHAIQVSGFWTSTADVMSITRSRQTSTLLSSLTRSSWWGSRGHSCVTWNRVRHDDILQRDRFAQNPRRAQRLRRHASQPAVYRHPRRYLYCTGACYLRPRVIDWGARCDVTEAATAAAASSAGIVTTSRPHRDRRDRFYLCAFPSFCCQTARRRHCRHHHRNHHHHHQQHHHQFCVLACACTQSTSRCFHLGLQCLVLQVDGLLSFEPCPYLSIHVSSQVYFWNWKWWLQILSHLVTYCSAQQ